MFDIIAVPVDGSEYGYKAADVAIEIAKKFDSKIAAIHVLEEFSFSNYGESEDNGNKILAKVTKKANDEGIDSKNIGFKVLLDDGTKIEIIEEQDEFNSNIFRDDEVIITRQIIDNRQFTDIELVGDMDE